MAAIIADNITSPLGMTTKENLDHIRSGELSLRSYSGKWGLPEPFVASMFSEEQISEIQLAGFTFFESIVLHSVRNALSQVKHNILAERTVLILSTTKANVDLLCDAETTDSLPSAAVAKIAGALGVSSEPIVVCNACISGVAALILSERLLDIGEYDNAIVCGCDVLGKFIVSGFQSLKALANVECRPFDLERVGMNLGEAAATIILSKKGNGACWHIAGGAVRNDAYHVTNPSPSGTGCRDALLSVLADTPVDDLAMVNVHGTATMYNDQMESKALESAGLSSVPINGLKGYFGHTMGAAGVLETIVTMHTLDKGSILATKGFSEIGVSGKVSISNETKRTGKQIFLKSISGFGGGNAAIKLSKLSGKVTSSGIHNEYTYGNSVKITPGGIYLNNAGLAIEGTGKEMLKNTYKTYIGDYPRFYKMDLLSQLGFIASELLLQSENSERFYDRKDRAIVLFNSSSSFCSDLEYQRGIVSTDNFFPSPSVFVYTLPNIVTGEIAIRNRYHAESSFYILRHKDPAMMHQIVRSTFIDSEIKSIMTGWVDVFGNDSFEMELTIINR